MLTWYVFAWLVLGNCWLPGPAADSGFAALPLKPPRTDRHGDPLPPGAAARLGTRRLRDRSPYFVLAPDDKTLAYGDGTVRLCEVPSGQVRKILTKSKPFSGDQDYIPHAFSPDGQLLMLRDSDSLGIWDTRDGRLLWKRQAAKERAYITGAFSSDGKRTITWGRGEAVRIQDTVTGSVLCEPNGADSPNGFRFAVSLDGRTLAGPSRNSGLRLWDAATGRVLDTFVRGGQPIYSTVISANGKTVVTINEGGSEIWMIDVATRRQQRLRLREEINESTILLRPDGRILCAKERNWRYLYLWDTRTGKELSGFGQREDVQGEAFSPDNRTFAMSSSEAIHLWDLETGERLNQITCHHFPEYHFRLSFSRTGNLLLAPDCQTVRIWDVAGGKELPGPVGAWDEVRHLAFSPDSRALATGGMDGTVRLWDVATGQQTQQLFRRYFYSNRVTFSDDGKSLATHEASGEKFVDSQVRIWDVATGHLRISFEQPRVPLRIEIWAVALAFSPDSQSVATAGICEGKIFVRDIHSNKVTAILRTPVVYALTFGPDGRTLLVNGVEPGLVQRPGLMLWDVPTGRVRRWLPAAPSRQLTISPDGKWLASLQDDGIQLWETVTWEQVHLHVPAKNVAAFAYTPEGHLLAAIGVRGWPNEAIELWDILKQKKQRDIVVDGSRITAAAFSPDGRLVATALDDTTVLLWDMRFGNVPGTGHRSLEEKSFDQLWADLAAEAPKAFRAILGLGDSPEQAVAYLKKRVQVVQAVDASQLAELIHDLDSDRFETRKKATQALEKLRERAEPALRKRLTERPSVEVRQRVTHLLEQLDGVPPANALRGLRVVQVLERIGTPQARKLLHELAQGDPVAAVTKDAQAALQRVNRRSN